LRFRLSTRHLDITDRPDWSQAFFATKIHFVENSFIAWILFAFVWSVGILNLSPQTSNRGNDASNPGEAHDVAERREARDDLPSRGAAGG
jgi:hypothetical protein